MFYIIELDKNLPRTRTYVWYRFRDKQEAKGMFAVVKLRPKVEGVIYQLAERKVNAPPNSGYKVLEST